MREEDDSDGPAVLVVETQDWQWPTLKASKLHQLSTRQHQPCHLMARPLILHFPSATTGKLDDIADLTQPLGNPSLIEPKLVWGTQDRWRAHMPRARVL